MKPGPRASQRTIARQRQQRQQLDRELAQEERTEQADRDDRQARDLAQRDQRDARQRQRAHEISQKTIAARRAASDAADDFEIGCAQLAAGQVGFERVQQLQRERDATRAAAEIWLAATGEATSVPAIAGRH